MSSVRGLWDWFYQTLLYYYPRTDTEVKMPYTGRALDSLPGELILHICGYLHPPDLIRLQSTSRRLLEICRDNGLWKQACFEHTRGELNRQRKLLEGSPAIRLVRAMEAVAAHEANDSSGVAQSQSTAAHKRGVQYNNALMARWDPSYPNEKSDFFQEYIHRHAPITLSWFQTAQARQTDRNIVRQEATGIGALYGEDQRVVDKLVAPLDDGSVCIWNASHSHQSEQQQGRIIARSAMGLLTGMGPQYSKDDRIARSKSQMTETGAVECVSIDSRQNKGYFAVMGHLNEVDLNTLQLVSRNRYPSPISALSEARSPVPLTVGTNNTIHLHDPRRSHHFAGDQASAQVDNILGSLPSDSLERLRAGDFNTGHASLAQPGTLSILHMPEDREWDGNGDIWIAGRFTSLLNYDRRFFPKVRGAVHSAARLSSLSLLPFPWVPHNFRSLMRQPSVDAIQEAKSSSGYTMLAAGEYKGKGSLELYGLSSDPRRSVVSTDNRTTQNENTHYRNRFTASRSKLLSASSHGCRLVFSDSDGVMKWMERDGLTTVREFNINDSLNPYRHIQTPGDISMAETNATPADDDLVQKIIPTIAPTLGGNGDISLGRDNLLIWTNDGLLGMVGFGKDALFEAEDLSEQAESALEAEQLQRERDFDSEMRKALESQAAELRWMQGLGMRA